MTQVLQDISHRETLTLYYYIHTYTHTQRSVCKNVDSSDRNSKLTYTKVITRIP